MKPRCKSLKEVISLSEPFFISPVVFNDGEKARAWPNQKTASNLIGCLKKLEQIAFWNAQQIESEIKQYVSTKSFSLGKIIMPLRLALFGSLNGPAVYDIIEILGKKEVNKRINFALETFSNI